MKILEVDKKYPSLRIQKNNIIKRLSKECSEIISLYKKNEIFLLRGIDYDRSKDIKAIKIKPKPNRIPKDSDVQLTKFMNQYLAYKGFELNRSNSLFATFSHDQASNYGNVFILFPKNGFKYIYAKSQHGNDLILRDGKYNRVYKLDSSQSISGYLYNTNTGSKLYKNIAKYMVKTYDDLFDRYAYKDNGEIVIDYHTLSTMIRDKKDDTITKMFDDSLVEYKQELYDFFDHQFNFTDKNLYDAASTEKEIYLHGECYAFNYDLYANFFVENL